MTTQIRTRFAPSPTGYMHIGNLRTALYAYLYAKAEKGSFILRIEDTDRSRYVPDAVDFINRTLEAARIIPDEGPGIGGSVGPYVQSERLEIYQEYAQKLIDTGFAYRCFCEPESAHSQDEFSGYDRTCRSLSAENIAQNLVANKPFVIRQKMPLDGETTYNDLVHGNITIANDTLEDQVLIKRDGMPTYNFANVIDDHLMGITHIIRGAEFITSTPKHVLLYKAFDWTPPAFIHLPPVMGKSEDGTVSKLSKRHGATSFDQLVRMGYLPEAITNYVALLGWSPKSNQEIFSMAELIEHFSLDGLTKSPAIFDYHKLDWLNGEYFKDMPDEKFSSSSLPFAGEIPAWLREKWSYLAALLKTRLARYEEIPEQISFLLKLPEYDIALFNNKRSKMNPEKAKEILLPAISMLEKVTAWTPDTIDAAIESFITETGCNKRAVMWPLRIAVSGQAVTPGGVTELLFLLGQEESLQRLKKGLAKLA